MNSLVCRDSQRRQTVQNTPNLSGLDYLEVSENQKTLTIYFLGKAPESIAAANVQIMGGRRIQQIKVLDVEVIREENLEVDDWMQVSVDQAGDFSEYELRLVEVDAFNRPTQQPLQGVDPRYAQVSFSFKVNCPSDLDCQQPAICPEPERAEPAISYLSKDYASFRQLILDRLSLIMPDWQERHVPDLGIAVVELLAYVGDYLSYYQDAVATEAYLGTARQRISIRRHARLMDYSIHEGCNARTWICVEMDQTRPSISLNPKDIYLITDANHVLPVKSSVLNEQDLKNISADRYEVFEPIVEEPGLLKINDIRNLSNLVEQLRQDANPLSAYLRSRFSRHTRRLIDQDTADSHQLLKALLDELNSILREPLYSQERFAQVQFSEPTQELLAENPQGDDLLQLNRWLLEDAYPRAIARTKLAFYSAHSEIQFYPWGDQLCCLPKGATTATLKDAWITAPTPPPPPHCEPSAASESYPDAYPGIYPAPYSPPLSQTELQIEPERALHLQPGDILILEEVKGAKTGTPADADPQHRHVVRLTKVEPAVDALYNQPIVEVEWATEEALPFALCISGIEVPSAKTDPPCSLLSDISVARGNVMLVDHGRSTTEDLGQVQPAESQIQCEAIGQPADVQILPKPFQPQLQQPALTFRQPLSRAGAAQSWLLQDPRQALPQIKLTGVPQPQTALPHPNWDWTPQPDLLASQRHDRHFVVEMDNERRAHLRFGNGELGERPAAGTQFSARYRVGNGAAGNVGAETISHIVFRQNRGSGLSLSPRNPFPAQGGTEPELQEEVKQFAPQAFRRTLARAITPDDYAQLAAQYRDDQGRRVQRAAATLRWTGNWYDMIVAIDPLGQETAAPDFLAAIKGYLHRYRRIGYGLQVIAADYVPLKLAMTICVAPHLLRGHVKAALLERFSNRRLADGSLGFFHPDQLSFGDPITVSQLVAAALSVAGVESATVTTLQRLGQPPNQEIANGILPIAFQEIAQLDSDPNFPEHGVLTFDLRGGR